MSEPTAPAEAARPSVVPTWNGLANTDPAIPAVPSNESPVSKTPGVSGQAGLDGPELAVPSLISPNTPVLASAGSAPRTPQILTIPWPQVPVNEESDPRRRIPVVAVITGVIGELLITAGLLLGLFVVWEILWSTVEAKPLQTQALNIVHERAGYVPPAPASSDFAPEYTNSVPEVALAKVHEPYLSLHVPRWGYKNEAPVAEGTDKAAVLDKGYIGHYTGTQNAGEIGNFAVAGHRITHGEPFAKIQALRTGDELVVETDENYIVYTVYDTKIVDPTDISVIWPEPGQEGIEPVRRLITLTTCHPRYTSTHRYIVWGEFEYWTKKSEGRLRALVPPNER